VVEPGFPTSEQNRQRTRQKLQAKLKDPGAIRKHLRLIKAESFIPKTSSSSAVQTEMEAWNMALKHAR
jgi:hypothetical protein